MEFNKETQALKETQTLKETQFSKKRLTVNF